MFRTTLTILLLTSFLSAQNYRWPIRASKSLSATFAEYRSGHLHAGIDIKTWGEMAVPCIAIADGYIEHIVVGYNGYGRGLWLRLKDGNVAVYGHLEQFSPIMEKLIRSEQLSRDKYSLRLKFSPDQYPVKAGEVIGYSGTSGTEHPHLHFEIRDSLRQLFNPQVFYPGIKDSQAPVMDEIMCIPAGPHSRINGSQFPVVLDMRADIKRISTTGPFQVSVNAHDRANGTYNKYNIYQAIVLVNDSLVFERQFDHTAMRLMDDVDEIYPGVRGRRGWRFMSLYDSDQDEVSPFTPENLSGIIAPAGLSDLQIKLSDIKGNEVSKSIIFHEQVLAHWELKREGENYVITRHFPEDGYENIQFYTGDNTYIPISETRYKLTSTSWVLGNKGLHAGVRSLGSAGGQIKWIVPPASQTRPELRHTWRKRGDGFVLSVESSEPHIFPLAYALTSNSEKISGELVQTTPTSVESNILPLEVAALADLIELTHATETLDSLSLSPMTRVSPGQQQTFPVDLVDAEVMAENTGNSDLYLRMDTSAASFNGQAVQGINIQVLNTRDSEFSGQLSFLPGNDDQGLGIFSPGKKKAWDRQIHPDSSSQFLLDLTEGGSFYLLKDTSPPVVKAKKSYAQVRRGQRLVFTIRDNTKVLKYPRTGIRATLDGTNFFPDYNPLRHELSFHVPSRLGSGQHIFEFSIQDETGNTTKFNHTFSIRS